MLIKNIFAVLLVLLIFLNGPFVGVTYSAGLVSYAKYDLNNDGEVQMDEIVRAINLYFNNPSQYPISDIHVLINFYINHKSFYFDELQIIDHHTFRYTDPILARWPYEWQGQYARKSIELASNLGFTSYLFFAEDTFPRLISWAPRPDIITEFRSTLDTAKQYGIKIYFHSNEQLWPRELNVKYGDTATAWNFLTSGLKEFFSLYPTVSGFSATGDETEGGVTTYTAAMNLHKTVADAVVFDGIKRDTYLRTWQRVNFMGDPVNMGVGDPSNVYFSLKNTRGDFKIINPVDTEFITKGDPSRKLIEFDSWREYETHSFFPIYLGDYWSPRFQLIADNNIRKIGVRINWNSPEEGYFNNNIYKNYINLYTFTRFAKNPYRNPDDILWEFVRKYFPQNSWQTVYDFYKYTPVFVKNMYYYNNQNICDHGRVNRSGKGNVILPSNWFSMVDGYYNDVLNRINAIPEGTSGKSEFLKGAKIIRYLSKGCGYTNNLSGDHTGLAKEWEKFDAVSYNEMRGYLLLQY